MKIERRVQRLEDTVERRRGEQEPSAEPESDSTAERILSAIESALEEAEAHPDDAEIQARARFVRALVAWASQSSV